jgi:predicted nucleic acid-binding protein
VTSGVAVFDSSALIVFWQIARLEFLYQLFAEVVVPAAVRREVVPSIGSLPSWIREHPVPRPPRQALALDPGEREAIALALELAADFVVLDDLPGRRVATRLRLPLIGSAGLLLRAHDFGLLHTIRADLDAMVAAGFFISPRLYLEILEAAGESPQ